MEINEFFSTDYREYLNQALSRYIEEVLKYYSTFIEEGKIFPDILYNLIIIYLWRDNKDKIHNFLEELLDKNNEYIKYLKLKEYIYSDNKSFRFNKDFPKNLKKEYSSILIDFYENHRKEFDNKPFYYKEFFEILGEYAAKVKNINDAFIFFSLSFLYSKDLASYYYNLGKMHYSNDRTQKAYNLLSSSIEIDDKNSDCLIEFSHVCAELDKETEAIKTLKLVHNRHPDYPDVSYRLGKYYLDNNNIKKAKKYFQKALKYNPKYTSANINYFYLLFIEGNKNKMLNFIDNIENNDLKDIFRFFYILEFKQDYGKLLDLLNKNDNISSEISIGLWDHFIGIMDDEHKLSFTEYLKNNKEILDKDKIEPLTIKFEG
ncbi:MAG: tetratricopeptide repeat protein [Candidatus Mcinerneyibacterium aminivorans]|uniref:Tetratricopeptide repeat protein n=1 Tax=Candidatus Mcinerneyibacterium aminivorans TaxID=2703815 RepID=A0A5D0MCG7_9BACT|nr:MAG: tetratricopeptide repeat protein [Candidatus Mcinerneyibacterium aminivorans]